MTASQDDMTTKNTLPHLCRQLAVLRYVSGICVTTSSVPEVFRRHLHPKLCPLAAKAKTNRETPKNPNNPK